MPAVSVSNWDIDDSQRHHRRREDQLEIAEWIEIAEVFPPTNEAVIVVASKELRTAQDIAERCLDENAQHIGKNDVAQLIQKAHRFGLHRVDEPAAVDEIGLSLLVGLVVAGQKLWRHGQVRVQDGEQITSGV